MSARCQRCGFPIVDGRLRELIADVTALLDLEVPMPEWLVRGSGVANNDHSAEAHLRIGAAKAIATNALAIANEFCGTPCAHADAREKTTPRQETA